MAKSIRRAKKKVNRRKHHSDKQKRADLRAKLQPELQRNSARCQKYLVAFWTAFNESKSGFERMDLLKEAANPPWQRISPSLLLSLRRQFRRRYTQYLVGISEECAICSGQKWREKHHIVPLSYGGINDNANLLGICMGCHDEIHPWMKA